jgi:hypothetical protein
MEAMASAVQSVENQVQDHQHEKRHPKQPGENIFAHGTLLVVVA